MWPSPPNLEWLRWFLPRFKIQRGIRRWQHKKLLRRIKFLRRRVRSLSIGDIAGLLSLFNELTELFPKNKRFKNFPSAASKLIWAINPEVGIIYDSQAACGLKHALVLNGFHNHGDYDTKVSISNYRQFVAAWHDLWSDRIIQRLIDDAVDVVRPADPRWDPNQAFRRRVLDQYLVTLADKTTRAKHGPREWGI
jgi:hypothetical protein